MKANLMKLYRRLFFLPLAAIVLASCHSHSAQTAQINPLGQDKENAAIIAAAKAFFKAWKDRNDAELREAISPKSHFYKQATGTGSASDEIRNELAPLYGVTLKSADFKIKDVSQKTARIDLVVPGTAGDKPYRFGMGLDKDGNGWKVSGIASYQYFCAIHLKMLTLGTSQFLIDSKGKFTLTTANLETSLRLYVGKGDWFHCPEESGDAPDYSFNSNLTGTMKDRIDSRGARIVMFYEGKSGHLDFTRHHGQTNICFVDGHVKSFKQGSPDLKKFVIWKP